MRLTKCENCKHFGSGPKGDGCEINPTYREGDRDLSRNNNIRDAAIAVHLPSCPNFEPTKRPYPFLTAAQCQQIRKQLSARYSVEW